MSVPPTLDLQGLLAEDQWIRRLARRLVGDGHASEDLVQDTWVAALDAHHPEPRNLRPWLRGILRNLWIDDKRAERARGVRERAAARDEALASTSELVAELELRRNVAEALLALEEPYRRALYLRFFKDQSLAAIAAREGLALSTIHERIQQGLEHLRARLDRERGGRRAWAVGVLALAEPASGSWVAAVETMAMAGAFKLAASILVVGAGVAWWWIEHATPERTPLTEAHAEAPPDEAARVVELASADAISAVRSELPISSAPEPPTVAHPEPRRIVGRVLDPHGLPVASVAVGWSDAPAGAEPGRSGSDGTFTLDAGDQADGAQVRDLEPDLVTLVPGTQGSFGQPESWVVVVAPRADFAGHVLGPDGSPIRGASVAFGLKEALFRELGLHRSSFAATSGRATTDEGGAFELHDVAGGDRVLLQVEAEGFWIAMADLPEASASDLVIHLERGAQGTTITGIVLEPGGAAVAGARVSAGDGIVISDRDGRFELTIDRPHGTFGPLEPEYERLRDRELGEPHLVALKPGFAPARERLADLDPRVPVVLRLGSEVQTIRGRVLDDVLDSKSNPRAGIVVWVRDPTTFGREIHAVAEGTTVAWLQTIEDELVGGFGQRGTTSDGRGEFELGGLLARSYELMAFDPGTAELSGPWTVAAGAREVELVLARDPQRTRVAGRVISVGGKPLAGVDVSPRRTCEEGASAHAQPPRLGHRKVVTDAEGRFDLGEIAPGGTELFLEGTSAFFLRSVRLSGFADLAHLELVEPMLCELQVDLTGDPGFADSVGVLDGQSRELEVMESFGNGWSLDTTAQFSAGLTSVLSVKETAATLVLRKDGVEVLRRPLRLDPGQRTTVRP